MPVTAKFDDIPFGGGQANDLCRTMLFFENSLLVEHSFADRGPHSPTSAKRVSYVSST